MELFYIITVVASSISAVLAWAAKLWWSKEHIAAKDEIIRAKDNQIELLNSHIKSLQELTPMKVREYFLSVREQLEEYIEKLQTSLSQAEADIELKDRRIELLQTEGGKQESEIQKLMTERTRLSAEYENLKDRLQKVSTVSESAGVSSALPYISGSNINRLLEIISHELLSSVASVRNNADFLQRRFEELGKDRIKVKLEDIIFDSNILMSQIEALRLTFGQSSSIARREKTDLLKDVIIPTINQLGPLVRTHGFEMSKIRCDEAEHHRIILYLDKARLSQVVYNILMNSIKYAESDPAKFSIKISIGETSDNFIIKFRDWGIGIRGGLEEEIFKEGFRAPESILKSVTGVGLGLYTSRKIMRDMGGDLKLANDNKPTEFQMILPKSLQKDIDDSNS